MLRFLIFQDSGSGERMMTRRCIATAAMRIGSENLYSPPQTGN